MNFQDLLNKIRAIDEGIVEAAQQYTLQVVENVKFDRNGQVTADGYMYDKDDNEIFVELEIDYSPAEQDSMSGPGGDAHTEITKITDENGLEIPLEDVAYDQDMVNEKVAEADSEKNLPYEESLDEGKMAEVDQILRDIASGDLDAYDIMSNPKTPTEQAAAQMLQQMYDTVASDRHLHPDDDFEQILDIVADQLADDYGTDESVGEGAYGDDGWEPPWEKPTRYQPDEDEEYERRRQRELDYPDEKSSYTPYVPSEEERAAEAEYRREKAEKLAQVMAMQDRMYSRIYGKKKKESLGEETMDECGSMDMMPSKPIEPVKQQDSVTMNVSMNGSGAGGIRDLMNILRNLESKPEPDFPSEPSISVIKKIDKKPILGAEEFANSPDEKVAPMSAVIPTGDDLHSKGKEAPKVNGGGNPLSLAARLESLYNEVKSR
jgi:hypothetical protein